MEPTVQVVEEKNAVIESIVTSGLSPDEVLKQLDSCGIDWYVTAKGDLLIRSWRIGAEDFIPPEQIAEIRETQTKPPEAIALEWLSNHLGDVRARFPNRWIAMVDNEIVADAESLPLLMQKTQAANIINPFITFIPGEPVVWMTAYGSQNI